MKEPMDEKEPVTRTKKKLTKTDDVKKSEKPDVKKPEKPDVKKPEKHKYPLTHVPSKSRVSMYVSKECEDLLWASIRSRR